MTVVFNVNAVYDDLAHVLKQYENLLGEGGRSRSKIATGGFMFIDIVKDRVLLV